MKVMTTSSVEVAQGALEIVQRNVYVFPEVPVKLELGLAADVTEPPAPEMMLQAPVPTLGVFAAKLVLVAHSVWSEPALAALGLLMKLTTMLLVELEQGKLEVVHIKV